MITKDYVSFETAKLLKEKKFLDPCRHYYFANGIFARTYGLKHKNPSNVNTYSAPTLQMAMKWLREIYNIIVEPSSVWNGQTWEYQLFIITPKNAASPYYEHNLYKSYEECVDAAIKYCLENLI